jgi:hypothetical protein
MKPSERTSQVSHSLFRGTGSLLGRATGASDTIHLLWPSAVPSALMGGVCVPCSPAVASWRQGTPVP